MYDARSIKTAIASPGRLLSTSVLHIKPISKSDLATLWKLDVQLDSAFELGTSDRFLHPNR